MSQFIDILRLTRTAPAAGVVANTFVNQAGATATAGGNTLGVAVHSAEEDEEFPVTVLGTEVVIAGGEIDQYGPVEVGANGRAVAHDAGTKVGYAQEAATEAGHPVEVLLLQN